ncbi:hypothetical protein M422DRAFT_36128, partial [Sphaerobolus stellatus SS14]
MTFYKQSNLEFTVLMLLLPCSTSSRPCRPFRFGVLGASAIDVPETLLKKRTRN